jgi:hypothetical protein
MTLRHMDQRTKLNFHIQDGGQRTKLTEALVPVSQYRRQHIQENYNLNIGNLKPRQTYLYHL